MTWRTRQGWGEVCFLPLRMKSEPAMGGIRQRQGGVRRLGESEVNLADSLNELTRLRFACPPASLASSLSSAPDLRLPFLAGTEGSPVSEGLYWDEAICGRGGE